MPNINLMSQFSVNNFSNYLDYISSKKKREHDGVIQEQNNVPYQEHFQNIHEAKNEQSSLGGYAKYIIAYMSNNNLRKKEEKNKKKIKKRTTAPFNENFHLSQVQMNQLKEDFNIAEKKGNVNFQDIISFKEGFLERLGIYDKEKDELNEDYLKQATNEMMKEMMEREKMDEKNTRWVANIHYDTDNIHIHISTTELINTRSKIINEDNEQEYKGKRKKKTIEKMKSKFANCLINNTEYLKEVTENRNELYQKLTTDNLNRKITKKISKLIKQLPFNKKNWQYGNKQVKHLQGDIDEITFDILEKNFPDEFRKFQDNLNDVAEFYQDTYGGDAGEKYKKNKMKDLNKRLGNKLLKEMRSHDQVKKENLMKINKKRNMKAMKRKKKYVPYSKPFYSKRDLFLIRQAIHNELQDYQNELIYERLEQRIAYERSKE